jgi:hypothetical protein
MKVGDLVKCRMFALLKNQLGIVVEQGHSTVRIHFNLPEEGRSNPRWVSAEFLEVVNESR